MPSILPHRVAHALSLIGLDVWPAAGFFGMKAAPPRANHHDRRSMTLPASVAYAESFALFSRLAAISPK